MTACASTPTSPVIARTDATFETTGLGKTRIAAKQYNGVVDERAGRIIKQGIGMVGKVLGTGSMDLKPNQYLKKSTALVDFNSY